MRGLSRRFWVIWTAINSVAALVLPNLYGNWLLAMIAEERRLDPGMSTDADSVSLPMFGFAERLWTIQVWVTVLLLVYHLWRRKRREMVEH